MTKLIGLALLLVLFSPTLSLSAQSAADQERERVLREQEQAFLDRATMLRRNIQQGWSPGEVASIMGPPDVVGRANDGGDAVETWWYHSYEVGIEFRNAAVSTWFFRFILR